MTQLLEIKEKLVRVFGRFETYIIIIAKFCVAYAVFATINSNIGYMSRISSTPVALILALLCSILPANATVLLGGLVVILDMYALAMEAAIVTIVLFLILYLLYYRFAPKDGVAGAAAPVLFRMGMPYLLPMVCGLMRSAQSVLAVVCGTVVYYFVDGVRLNAAILTSAATDDENDSVSKLNIIVGQLKGNKEMILVILIFVVASLVVYSVRRLAVEHAWTIAIVAGTVVQIVGLSVGYTMLGISGRTAGVIVGGLISMLICFVIQFFAMNLDYARTERVQFEDDDYYYYVVAVPKRMIASREKKVQRFGSTRSMGRKTESAGNTKKNVEAGKQALAEEFDIDENLLK
jgi:hypothetical protein